ncbi:uncharacterized protein lrrc53 [Eucyclogobius newberryi]|uniref:uncharacterized protein lrrc53 n=1 Tax=Eucyclogobius newberryi TaxID=166745 RepID=UPI003B5AFF92
MTSVLLMLLLLIKAHSVSSFPSCPASCVVCSKEAVICQRLTSIIDAPQTTQALLLTEGSISTVQPGPLSDLTNVTLISLSHNHITALDKNSFRNMPLLQTLLLDHNLLTLQALEGGVLTNLTQLEVLALGNNRIDMISSDLFKGTKSLRILKLEGNQITRLDSGSFPLMSLSVLESLDLSDNFIDYLDKNSFRGLISLKTLDLSRNRLQSAPHEAFLYLTWLNTLNLDLNTWNCSCQLLELAAFLSSFIQEPDKTLYNGRRMVCVSADNPAVTTVLGLTEANCVPSNQNITVRVDTRGSITSQLYVRDLAITGAVCFAGGVGLTLLIVLIYFKITKKKKLEEQNQEEVKEQASSTMSNHNRNHIDMAEKRKDFINGNETMDGPVGPRTEGNGGHFHCPECRGEAHAPNPVRWERMNGRVDTLEDRERQGTRVEEDRRRTGPQQRIMGREAMNKHLVGNNLDIEGQNRQDVLHCGSCHRTYRPNQMDHNARQARLPPRGNSPMYGFQQQRPSDSGRNNFYTDFDLRSMKRETRNVTFVLDSPRRGQGEDGQSEETTSPRGKEGGESGKLQSDRQIKVKLNLNPLRKSKVHPKKKGDEKGSPRKSTDKSSDKESKRDRRKAKKSKDEKKEKKSREQETTQETVAQIAPQNPMAHMQGLLGPQFRGGSMLLGNRATNLLGVAGPQLPTSGPFPFQAANLMAQGKPMFPTTNPLGSSMNMSGPSMSPGGAPTMGLMNNPNLSLANVIQPNQANVNTASLLASPATRQVNITQASSTTLPASANTFQSSVALQPNTNLRQDNPTMSQGNVENKEMVKATNSTKQASTSTLSANVTSEASSAAKQTSPTTLSANSSSQNLQALATLAPPSSAAPSGPPPDSKSSPKNSPRGQPKSAQEEPVLQSNKKTNPATNPVTLEIPTSPRKGSQTPIVTDSSQMVVPQNTPAATMVKNMSTASLTESIHGEAMGVVTQAELPTGGRMAVGGTQGADVSVSDVLGRTESVENMASTTLIQEEYLTEDGVSSPKRKLRLVIPEKTTNRPQTALERKIR